MNSVAFLWLDTTSLRARADERFHHSSMLLSGDNFEFSRKSFLFHRCFQEFARHPSSGHDASSKLVDWQALTKTERDSQSVPYSLFVSHVRGVKIAYVCLCVSWLLILLGVLDSSASLDLCVIDQAHNSFGGAVFMFCALYMPTVLQSPPSP